MSELKAIEAWLEDADRRDAFSGHVLVARGGEVRVSRSYGYANRADRVPNGADTRFAIASVGKMLTAAAIGRFVDRGVLDFDAPAGDLVSGLPMEMDALRNVRLRHLLSHTSGIPDYADESKLCAGDVVGGWGVHPATLRSLADYAARLPRGAPAFPPGEKYEYSNSNYVLLGLVLERVSGLSYEACLDREVLRPAGMTDTGLFALDEVRPRVATGYLPPGSEQGAGAPWRSNVLAVPARGGPDGGIYATAADLLAFVEALHGHRLLTPATTRLMLDAKVWEDEQWGYAYGFQHRKLGDGTAAVGHSGEDPGASARVFWTEGGWTVIVLSNMSRATGEVVWPIVRAIRAEA